MLTTGLDILRILAEAEEPLTATAIAQRVGLHVSNVSRTLRVLITHGYVRKPSYHSFAVDLGVLSLAGSAVQQLPVLTRSRDCMQRAAQETLLHASLATLHRDQVLYLHRCSPDGTCISAVAGGFPLHLSVVGLRLLLDLEEPRALTLLSSASQRYGWERPTARTPKDPEDCLAKARDCLRGPFLHTNHWDLNNEQAVAVPLSCPGYPPLAISLHGVTTMNAHAIETALAHIVQDLSTALETIS